MTTEFTFVSGPSIFTDTSVANGSPQWGVYSEDTAYENQDLVI